MRAPLSWLRDYAPLDGRRRRPGRRPVQPRPGRRGRRARRRAASTTSSWPEVLDIRPHPDADRIRLVDVDAGEAEPLQIVCGAWNFAVGDLVPLAPVGAVLPGGFEIARRKMRGEWSNGMLCSAPRSWACPTPAGVGRRPARSSRAGLAAPGTPLVEALGPEPDVVFDLDISPNRPDALCMAGVARDLAAALGEPWAAAHRAAVPSPVDPSRRARPVAVEAGDLCPRFTGTVLEGVPTDRRRPGWPGA